MHLVAEIALFFHLVGFASIFGVCAVQVRQSVRIARNGMMHGALTQLISGLILVATADEPLNHVSLRLKSAILLAILGILFYYRRDKDRIIPATPFFIVFGFTFLEVIVAVFFLR